MKTLRPMFFAMALFVLCTSLVCASDPESIGNFHPDKGYDSSFYIDSNLEFTLLHELAYAVIDINHVPVLGGQESAADQIAIMLMIITHHRIDRDLLDRLIAISGEWMMEWQEELATGETVYWDNHPLQIQRFYELTCLVYGADPDSVETIRTESWLPIQRAWYCNQEYIKNREALAWLAKQYSHFELDADWNLTPQELQHANLGKVKLQIGPPITDAGKKVHSFLVNSKRLKYVIARSNQILKLDRDINIVFESGCSGPDVWWSSEKSTVFVCYELLAQFSKHSRRLPHLIGNLATEPEFTMLLSFPEDVQDWMKKDSVSLPQLNQKITGDRPRLNVL